MSCVIEYVVIRVLLNDAKASDLVITSILMNLASYALISIFMWRLIG